MGDVIPMPPRHSRKSDTAVVLSNLLEKEDSGELQGSIHIATTEHGTEFHVLGTCADRLQNGVLALVKGLNFITEKIVATGGAGASRSDAFSATWKAPKKKLPRRLRESTKLGDLE